MEFKATIIQTVIHGKAYLQGQELNLKYIDLNLLNILNLKRALCFFKKVGKEWVRSNFFEYKAFLENGTREKEIIFEEKESIKKVGRPKKEV
jgi:hypothetical protein